MKKNVIFDILEIRDLDLVCLGCLNGQIWKLYPLKHQGDRNLKVRGLELMVEVEIYGSDMVSLCMSLCGCDASLGFFGRVLFLSWIPTNFSCSGCGVLSGGRDVDLLNKFDFGSNSMVD